MRKSVSILFEVELMPVTYGINLAGQALWQEGEKVLLEETDSMLSFNLVEKVVVESEGPRPVVEDACDVNTKSMQVDLDVGYFRFSESFGSGWWEVGKNVE